MLKTVLRDQRELVLIWKGRCARARDHLRGSCVSCMQGLLKNNMADLVCSISPFPRLFLWTSFLRRGRNSFRGVRRRRICLHFKLLCFSWRNLLKICRYFVEHIPKDNSLPIHRLQFAFVAQCEASPSRKTRKRFMRQINSYLYTHGPPFL